MMKIIGIILFILGLFLMVYGFIAPAFLPIEMGSFIISAGIVFGLFFMLLGILIIAKFMNA